MISDVTRFIVVQKALAPAPATKAVNNKDVKPTAAKDVKKPEPKAPTPPPPTAKKEFVKVCERLHVEINFDKTSTILGSTKTVQTM